MARLDFTATNILTAAEMDELARQAISNVTNAGKPTGAAEGETIAVTDKDRHEYWNGSAWVRGTNWTATGRTSVEMTTTLVAVGAGGTAEAGGWAGTDVDGFFQDWDGSHYIFEVPSGCGGLYTITVFSNAAAGVDGTSAIVLVTDAGTAAGYVPVGFDLGVISFTFPLAAGEQWYIQQVNGDSGSLNFDLVLRAYRISA
jgi:hypothetical protein